MRLWPKRLSLSSRYVLSVAMLLAVLVGAILFVIQKREVNIISEQARNRGVLIARNIASLNLEPLMFRDEDTIKKNIDAQVDDRLLYIMFFDRFNTPLVGTELAREDEEVVSYSRLPAVVDENTAHFESRVLARAGRKLHVLEVEIPVFAKGSTIKWGSIKIGLSLDDMRAEVRKTRLILIAIGLAGLLLGLFSAAVLGRRIASPSDGWWLGRSVSRGAILPTRSPANRTTRSATWPAVSMR